MKGMIGRKAPAQMETTRTLSALLYAHEDPPADERSHCLKTLEPNHCPLSYTDRKAAPREPCLEMKTMLSVRVCI